MRKLWPGAVLFAAASLAYGQLDSNTVTVTASRTVNLQPDQVAIGVYVNSSIATNLDDVIAGLPGAGLSLANLSSVYTQVSGTAQTLQWSFTLTAPLAKLTETLATLNGLQAARKSGLTLTYYLQGTQVSAELQAAHPCPLPALLSDAQAQAQKVAAAAGMSVGPVVSMADGSGTAAAPFAFTAIAGIYDPLTGPMLPILRPTISNSPPGCSLVVQFRLK